MSKEAIERMLTNKRNAYYIYWHNEEHIKAHARKMSLLKSFEQEKEQEKEQREAIRQRRKEEAKKEANRIYEAYLLEKRRDAMQGVDTFIYSWDVYRCKKHATPMFSDEVPTSDFNYLSLLLKSDEKSVKQWLEAN